MQIEMLWVFLGGMAASFANVFAGGGSLITIPLLMFVGLPAAVANGTNKIGLLAGTTTATSQFIRKKIIKPKELLFTVPMAIIGGIIGSLFSINLSESLYRMLLSIVMILVLILLIVRPQRFIHRKERSLIQERVLLMTAFLFIGFYGGFIQAGMGFTVIIALSLFSTMDLVRISAYKATIGFTIVLFSSLVFIISGNIDWKMAIVLALGNAAGGWLGSHLTIKGGEKIVRPILAVAVILMALKLSGVADALLG